MKHGSPVLSFNTSREHTKEKERGYIPKVQVFVLDCVDSTK